MFFSHMFNWRKILVFTDSVYFHQYAILFPQFSFLECSEFKVSSCIKFTQRAYLKYIFLVATFILGSVSKIFIFTGFPGDSYLHSNLKKIILTLVLYVLTYFKGWLFQNLLLFLNFWLIYSCLERWIVEPVWHISPCITVVLV